MYLVKSRKYFKKKKIKTKEQLLLEEERAIFSENLTENFNRLEAKRHSLRYKVKKVTKKKFVFVKKIKLNKDRNAIVKRFAFFFNLWNRKNKKRSTKKKKKR